MGYNVPTADGFTAMPAFLITLSHGEYDPNGMRNSCYWRPKRCALLQGAMSLLGASPTG